MYSSLTQVMCRCSLMAQQTSYWSPAQTSGTVLTSTPSLALTGLKPVDIITSVQTSGEYQHVNQSTLLQVCKHL